LAVLVFFRFVGFPIGRVRLSREAVGGVSCSREAVVKPWVKGLKSFRHGGHLGTKSEAIVRRCVQGRVGALAVG
jgi:hypothetical protein